MTSTPTEVNPINLTPHPVVLYRADTPDRCMEGQHPIIAVWSKSEAPARIEAEYASSGTRVVEPDGGRCGTVDVPARCVSFGRIVDLPDPDPTGRIRYIVSLPVALAAVHRSDLLVVDREVRNLEGTVIGCRGVAFVGSVR